MKIEVFVETEGTAAIERFEFERDSQVRELARLVAARKGFSPDELHVFLEDADEPLDISDGLDRDERIYHVHSARKLEVKVFYGNREAEHQFPPSARVQRVLKWAVRVPEFRIDPTLAPEMELALHGESAALPKEAHIGRFVKDGRKALALDLIRGIIPNGQA